MINLIHNIINAICIFFKREDHFEDDVSPLYEDVTNIPPKQSVETIHKISVKKNIINKSQLMHQIKTNIFFLDELQKKLEGKEEYKVIYNKVTDLKNQSEDCFKIIFRIKTEAIYYENTLEIILQHTQKISQLLNFKLS